MVAGRLGRGRRDRRRAARSWGEAGVWSGGGVVVGGGSRTALQTTSAEGLFEAPGSGHSGSSGGWPERRVLSTSVRRQSRSIMHTNGSSRSMVTPGSSSPAAAIDPSSSSGAPEPSDDEPPSGRRGGLGLLGGRASLLESAGITTVATIPVVAAAAVTPMATTVVTAAALTAKIRRTTWAPWRRRAPAGHGALARRCRGRSSSPLSISGPLSKMVACIRATMSDSPTSSSSGPGSRMAACMRATISDSPANSSTVTGAADPRINVATRPYQAGASSVAAVPFQSRSACTASNCAISIQRSSGVIRPAPPPSPSLSVAASPNRAANLRSARWHITRTAPGLRSMIEATSGTAKPPTTRSSTASACSRDRSATSMSMASCAASWSRTTHDGSPPKPCSTAPSSRSCGMGRCAGGRCADGARSAGSARS